MMPLAFSLLAGALMPLAFAPFGIYVLGFISPAILLYTWLKATPKQAFMRGLFFGIGFFTVGTSWIYISIHVYGKAPISLSALITALFILLMAMYPATQGYVLKKLFKNPITFCLCAFPATWVLWEFLREWLFTGFPWLLLGYTQTSTWINGLAPIFGVYGLSLAVALTAGALVVLSMRTRYPIKILCVAIILLFPLAGWELSKINWTKPAGKPVKFSLVQGNVKQELKWQPNQLLNILKIYKNLTEKNWASKIIIWPEAAIPTFAQNIPGYISLINQQAKQRNIYLITGIPIYHKKTDKYYNGLIMLGAGKGVYLKHHLVPFGEYIPLQSIFSGIMKKLDVPMSNFSAGPEYQRTIKAGQYTIAPYICYEIAYPDLVLETIKNKNFIVVITDDSWFGRSIALSQHLQISQMRSLETGRWLMLTANTGITAFINPKGKVVKYAKLDKRTVLTSQAVPMTGSTPMMQWDDYPVVILLVLLLLLALLI